MLTSFSSLHSYYFPGKMYCFECDDGKHEIVNKGDFMRIPRTARDARPLAQLWRERDSGLIILVLQPLHKPLSHFHPT